MGEDELRPFYTLIGIFATLTDDLVRLTKELKKQQVAIASPHEPVVVTEDEVNAALARMESGDVSEEPFATTVLGSQKEAIAYWRNWQGRYRAKKVPLCFTCGQFYHRVRANTRNCPDCIAKRKKQ